MDFYRGWTEYKRGFGNLTGEFWLGLDNLHSLTTSGKYKLRVDPEDFYGSTYYAEEAFPSNGHHQTFAQNFALPSQHRLQSVPVTYFLKNISAHVHQTSLLRTFHLLSGCNNCRHSIRENGEYFFLGIEPRELHKFDSRFILIKLLRYMNYEIRHS